jgi:Protein of unknown function (DUF1236)
MRSKLLITTAALLASVALASAQNVPGGGPSGGAAQSPGAPGAAGQDRQSPQSNQAPRAQDKGAQDKGAQDKSAPDKGKQGQAQGTPGQKEMRGQKDQTTGQAPRGQDDQKAQSQDGQKDKGKAQNQRGQKDQTTGQGQQPGQSPTQTQREQRDPAQGQSQQRQQGQQPGQAQQPGQGQPGQAAQGRSGSSVTLTTEQRTKIRETVLVGGNAPRVTNVNFSISVGTTVPRTVRVVAVPAPLIEIYPEWRGHMYFVVGDEIIIVDNNHRIIAVIAV